VKISLDFHENRCIHDVVKGLKSMKMTEKSLERELEKRLRDLLESIPGLGNDARVERNPAASERPYDFKTSIDLPRTGDQVEFRVECKALPRPSQFPYINLGHRFRPDHSRETVVPVLAAPHISPRMAELCNEYGWSWFDLAGNCRLVVPGSIYIERTGRKPAHKRPKPKANLGTAASARVLRALLAPANAGNRWTQTSLQLACEPSVSIGLVNKVVTHLHDEAWLIRHDDARFQVKDAPGLLETWGQVYRFDRHRRIGYFTLRKEAELEHSLAMLADSAGKAAYAVYSAADRQAPNVRQNKTWLYVNDEALDDFVRTAEAKEVDSGENLVVLIPDDDGVFYGCEPPQRPGLGTTNPVQTWLDLRHAGGRGAEAAEALMDQRLKPQWKGVPDA
jgi:hypothetical protein